MENIYNRFEAEDHHHERYDILESKLFFILFCLFEIYKIIFTLLIWT